MDALSVVDSGFPETQKEEAIRSAHIYNFD